MRGRVHPRAQGREPAVRRPQPARGRRRAERDRRRRARHEDRRRASRRSSAIAAIAYLAGPAHVDPASRRLEGFRSGIRAAGLRVPARHVRRARSTTRACSPPRQRLLARAPRPTALAVWSPTAAVPALAAVRRLGLRVPEQISVIAFNDSPIAGYLEPPLTTVHMPLAEMAGRRRRLPARGDRRRGAPRASSSGRRPRSSSANPRRRRRRPSGLTFAEAAREDGPRGKTIL